MKYQGKAVKIGDQEYILPSLSVKQAKQLWPQLLDLDKIGATAEEIKRAMPEKFDDMLKIIHAALSRNYSEITVEQLEESVSISQIKQLILIVSGQSGFDTAGETKPDVAAQPTVH